MTPLPHVFSVDVEEYFHVEAFSDVVQRDRWDTYPSRLDYGMRVLLDMLDDTGMTGTFFVLGWVAERHPALLREIGERGHELACHSFWHRPVFRLTPPEFEADVRQSRDAIEQASGAAVQGYRAPSFSITRRSLWALDVLAECGFTYDSSIFPIHHDLYGIPDGPRRPFRTSGGRLTVFPMTTFRLVGRHNWPVGGGGYLRLLPWWYTRWGIRRAEREAIPLISYVHPWELDPEQPRIAARAGSMLRHYTNIRRLRARLRRLLGLHRFSSFRDSGWLERDTPAEALAGEGQTTIGSFLPAHK